MLDAILARCGFAGVFIPLKTRTAWVFIGEKVDDLKDFKPAEFAASLFD